MLCQFAFKLATPSYYDGRSFFLRFVRDSYLPPITVMLVILRLWRKKTVPLVLEVNDDGHLLAVIVSVTPNPLSTKFPCRFLASLFSKAVKSMRLLVFCFQFLNFTPERIFLNLLTMLSFFVGKVNFCLFWNRVSFSISQIERFLRFSTGNVKFHCFRQSFRFFLCRFWFFGWNLTKGISSKSVSDSLAFFRKELKMFLSLSEISWFLLSLLPPLLHNESQQGVQLR